MIQPTICACKRGYASPIDNRCRACRSRADQKAFEGYKRAHAKGYEAGTQFPTLIDAACPYRTEPYRAGWIAGKNDAHRKCP